MKIIFLLARILLGLGFTVFGLNGFFHFLPMPPMAGDPADFFGVLFRTHYYVVIFGTQLVGGLLLLFGQYVPLGLLFLAPILVNIITFHVTMAPEGLPMALFFTLLWAVVAWANRAFFKTVLERKS